MTSWCVSSSSSRMRSRLTDAFFSMAAAALRGILPMSAIARAASISILTHRASFTRSSQIAAASGIAYRSITRLPSLLPLDG